MKKFRLIKVESISKPRAEIFTYEHIKTGALAVHIDCDDRERAFTIQFRTLPYSDNGICHILEHSVLAGSRKYNVKEPFVELLKGSMNTFLNAMTFPDKTVYPFSTVNEKEFFNLMDIYLDAVFFPNIYRDENIMAQEGWHYEIDENEDLSINGVVYNEMKGVLSQPDQVLYQEIQSNLYDNVYRYNSGGNPNSIPELGQKEFEEFHRKYYHPSNSVTALYGDMDIEKALDKLDEYFDEFDRGKKAETVPETEAFDKPKKIYTSYPVMRKESSQCMAGIGLVQGSYRNIKDNVGLKILTDVLFMQESSPVRNMLLDSGLVHDVYAMFDDSLVQPMSIIVLRGMEEDFADTVLESVQFELERIHKEGIDRELVEASINQWKFSIREGFEGESMPKGIILGMDAISNMDRGQDPSEKINYEAIIDSIEEIFERGYMEELLEKYYLKNTHRISVIMLPDDKAMNRKKEKFRENMSEVKKLMTEEDLKEIRLSMDSLRKRQLTDDSPHEIAKIPKISVEDLDRDIEKVEYEKMSMDSKGEFYRINSETSGISYLTINIMIDDIKEKELPLMALAVSLMGFSGTKNRDYIRLNKEIMKYTGGISIEPAVYDMDGIKLYLQINMKFLDEYMKKAVDILEDIVMNTDFEDSSRIQNAVNMIRSGFEMDAVEHGNVVAGERLSSYFSKKSYLNQKLTGIDFYEYIKDISSDYENYKGRLSGELENIHRKMKKSGDIKVIYQGSMEGKVMKSLEEWLSDMKNETEDSRCEEVVPKIKNEAILIPSEVNYIAKGYNFKELGYQYTGAMHVAKKIIDTDFLWEKVRVIGGAYGCRTEIKSDGSLYIASFRDPNTMSTLDTYDRVSDYLRDFSASKEDMDRYIVGTMSQFSKPVSKREKMQIAVMDIFEGRGNDFRQKTVNEIIDTTSDDVKNLSEMFKEIMAKGCCCAIGSKKIEEETECFDVRYL